MYFSKSFNWDNNKNITLKIILNNANGSLLKSQRVQIYDGKKSDGGLLLANVTTSKTGELKLSLSIKKESNGVWLYYIDEHGEEVSFWHFLEKHSNS